MKPDAAGGGLDNDHLMGVFRESYTILQNEELLRLVEPMLDHFDEAFTVRNERLDALYPAARSPTRSRTS